MPTQTVNNISIKKFLRKKCSVCAQTTSLYEHLCPICRRPTTIDFNPDQVVKAITDALDSLDRAQLVLSKNNFIKSIFDESVGAYLDQATTLAMLNRWIDQQFPQLDAEILDILQAQPSLQHIMNPLRLNLGEMRSKLERARQSALEKIQRNPVEVLFTEYNKKYYEYNTLSGKLSPEQKIALETDLTRLIDRIRQIFAKIQKGQADLLNEIARFHSSVDAIIQQAPIIQRQAEEYDLLEKSVKAMIRIPVT